MNKLIADEFFNRVDEIKNTFGFSGNDVEKQK